MLARNRWGLHVAVPGLVAILVAGGCATSDPDIPPGHGRVVRVVDGDTVVVDLDGHERTVRLLGIDTPETHHPDRPVECHGPEAAARLAELLPAGTEVRLERDVEPLDRYGRLLAHVVRQPDGLVVSRVLAAEGRADALRIPPNTALAAELAADVAAARDARRGLWGACPDAHAPATP